MPSSTSAVSKKLVMFAAPLLFSFQNTINSVDCLKLLPMRNKKMIPVRNSTLTLPGAQANSFFPVRAFIKSRDDLKKVRKTHDLDGVIYNIGNVDALATAVANQAITAKQTVTRIQKGKSETGVVLYAYKNTESGVNPDTLTSNSLSKDWTRKVEPMSEECTKKIAKKIRNWVNGYAHFTTDKNEVEYRQHQQHLTYLIDKMQEEKNISYLFQIDHYIRSLDCLNFSLADHRRGNPVRVLVEKLVESTNDYVVNPVLDLPARHLKKLARKALPQGPSEPEDIISFFPAVVSTGTEAPYTVFDVDALAQVLAEVLLMKYINNDGQSQSDSEQTNIKIGRRYSNFIHFYQIVWYQTANETEYGICKDETENENETVLQRVQEIRMSLARGEEIARMIRPRLELKETQLKLQEAELDTNESTFGNSSAELVTKRESIERKKKEMASTMNDVRKLMKEMTETGSILHLLKIGRIMRQYIV